MRIMYDSTDPNAIPIDAEMVAGYIDGTNFRWPESAWNRWPKAIKVRIARRTTTNDGHVLDVEKDIPTVWPLSNPTIRRGIRDWVAMRRKAGIDPAIYCNELNDWVEVRRIFREISMTEPKYWVARYNNILAIPSGAIGRQFANPPVHGRGHFDLSIMADNWPTEEDDMTPEEHNWLEDQSYRSYYLNRGAESIPKDSSDPLWLEGIPTRLRGEPIEANQRINDNNWRVYFYLQGASEIPRDDKRVPERLWGEKLNSFKPDFNMTLVSEGQIVVRGQTNE